MWNVGHFMQSLIRMHSCVLLSSCVFFSFGLLLNKVTVTYRFFLTTVLAATNTHTLCYLAL